MKIQIYYIDVIALKIKPWNQNKCLQHQIDMAMAYIYLSNVSSKKKEIDIQVWQTFWREKCVFGSPVYKKM